MAKSKRSGGRPPQRNGEPQFPTREAILGFLEGTSEKVGKREIARAFINDRAAQVVLAGSIYRQAVLQQQQGTASLTDVLLADNALREAQQEYLDAIIDFLRADLDLRKHTGNLNTLN